MPPNPPDNVSFMWAAYTVALVVYGLYAVNLLRRRARVRDALEREERQQRELNLQGGGRGR